MPTKGERISSNYRKKAGFSILKSDLAGQLRRSRPTIDKWITLAIQSNKDFANAYLYQWQKHGDRAPLNPYQVWILRAISNYQPRAKDPKKLRTDKEIIAFIEAQKFTLSDFLATIPIFEEKSA